MQVFCRECSKFLSGAMRVYSVSMSPYSPQQDPPTLANLLAAASSSNSFYFVESEPPRRQSPTVGGQSGSAASASAFLPGIQDVISPPQLENSGFEVESLLAGPHRLCFKCFTQISRRWLVSFIHMNLKPSRVLIFSTLYFLHKRSSFNACFVHCGTHAIVAITHALSVALPILLL